MRYARHWTGRAKQRRCVITVPGRHGEVERVGNVTNENKGRGLQSPLILQQALSRGAWPQRWSARPWRKAGHPRVDPTMHWIPAFTSAQ